MTSAYNYDPVNRSPYTREVQVAARRIYIVCGTGAPMHAILEAVARDGSGPAVIARLREEWS